MGNEDSISDTLPSFEETFADPSPEALQKQDSAENEGDGIFPEQADNTIEGISAPEQPSFEPEIPLGRNEASKAEPDTDTTQELQPLANEDESANEEMQPVQDEIIT